MSELKRFGVSIDQDLLNQFDNITAGIYNNRSEAIRDLIREKIMEAKNKEENTEVAGTLTLIYDHHKKGLTDKMIKLQHDYHCLFKSNLHLHLNHDYCLEVIVVEGNYRKLKEITSKIRALKGVKHGRLVVSNLNEVENNA
ncbi:nickel-responsive transcriptional regulator NikR [Halanaerobium hydrogeniformans]|uniref:Putative nickel-responsive regulator n=1 Tax=Halanaerobium hydrogeniformans TaxID=656519 RepID=E4RKB1_HALHG|nr:nickel-responsive transcriptional regulator NikR [Halanaerobium hydrogeniformans]ADQ15624.1 transcriptional regulator NikR, CopG family [Halanaerobium hydrogeniformans]